MLATRDDQPRRRPAVRLKLPAGTAARAWVPTALVPSFVAARSWIGRQRPGRVEVARESMRLLVGPEADAAEIERLTEAYLLRATWRNETRWRPSLVTN